MSLSQPADDLAAGRVALEAGAWQQALHAFERALATEESPEALEGLGLAAWWLDLARRRVRFARARLSRLSRAAAIGCRPPGWPSGSPGTAPRSGAKTGVANGWLQRARRLLEGQPDSAEHAFLAARAAVFALLDDGDPEEAETLAAEAIRVGQALGAIDYEMVGRALHGFALVTTGPRRRRDCASSTKSARRCSPAS